MPSGEIFPNPTVKQVIFQIRFPSLFYIEDKIGEFQLEILEKFPESNLSFRKQFVFVDVKDEVARREIIEGDEDSVSKIWQFKSNLNYDLNVLDNSLDITSRFHKTYNNSGSDNRFRDIIEFCVDKFINIVRLPILSRIGLRYIDECPMAEITNESFLEYYNPSFDLSRVDISMVNELNYQAVIKKDDCFLTIHESIREANGEHKFILDFDGYKANVKTSEYLAVTDILHDIIDDRYRQTIKEPVKEWMRRSEE